MKEKSGSSCLNDLLIISINISFQRREKLRLLELRSAVSAGGDPGGNRQKIVRVGGGGVLAGSQVTRALVSAVGPRKFL